jgi:hypothetical protein
MSIPDVPGAYPHPYVDGGSTNVVSEDAAVARRIARQVHGVVGPSEATRSSIIVGATFPADHVLIRKSGRGYVLELGTAIAAKLAADEHALRYRF